MAVWFDHGDRAVQSMVKLAAGEARRPWASSRKALERLESASVNIGAAMNVVARA